MDQPAQLQKKWKGNMEREIIGKYGSYKIDKDTFLGRGGFGIVYGGIGKSLDKSNDGKETFREVAIKQFKRSQKWKHEDDFDKEVLLLQRYGKMLKSQFILQVIDVFQEKETFRYFLITSLAKGGNLCEKLRSSKDEEEWFQFALRMAQILKYIHYDAMESFRSKEKAEEQTQKIAIIHRDVKPQNIVFLNSSKEMKDVYLLDFGVAKVGYSELTRGYNNCGTVYYKAPQVNQGRIYNSKVDIYSFGCTLFQLINGGQRLITSSGTATRYGDRERFVKNKLIDLQQRLSKQTKIKNPYFWIQLLHNCLNYEVKKRFNSIELLDFIEGYDLKKEMPSKQFLEDPTDQQKKNKAKREIFQQNFQIFRLTIIQDLIFTIFQSIYFQQPLISKFLLYVIIKFILKYFLDKNARLKERLKMEASRKSQQQKAMIEEKKLEDLAKKAHQKIEKQLQKDANSNYIQNKKTLSIAQDMVLRYPEIMHQSVAEPKRILYEFCYQKRNDILFNQKFARLVTMIISYMQDVDYYDQLRIQGADLESFDIEVLSLRKLNTLKKVIDEKLTKEGVRLKLQSCRVEMTLKSNINREENKTDVQIERIS